jgi:Predicted dehydrogenases and related proteins
MNKPTHADNVIRCGIIGLGWMGLNHAAAIASNPRLRLSAVSDVRDARTDAAKLRCKWLSSAQNMMSKQEVDAVVIATPHWTHWQLAIEALKAGLHVICEKPFTVTAAQADEVLQVASGSPGLLATVYQTRFEPAYQYVKQLLNSGELGQAYRYSLIESMWRTDAYYRNSPWRGTWKGEGGGVLLNQAPHLLDRYAWLFGMPATVIGQCDTTLHKIEVEDTASAICRHPDGAHGFIHISANECPAISEMVISCDRGRITVRNGRITVNTLRDSIRQRTANDSENWGAFEGETRNVPGELINSPSELLNAFYGNFVEAVDGHAALVSPGSEGRAPVELANAIALSSATGNLISLPINRADYEAFLASKGIASDQYSSGVPEGSLLSLKVVG